MNIKDCKVINHYKIVCYVIIRNPVTPAKRIFTYLEHHWLRNVFIYFHYINLIINSGFFEKNIRKQIKF